MGENLIKFILSECKYKQTARKFRVIGLVSIFLGYGIEEGKKMIEKYFPNEKEMSEFKEGQRIYYLLKES